MVIRLWQCSNPPDQNNEENKQQEENGNQTITKEQAGYT